MEKNTEIFPDRPVPISVEQMKALRKKQAENYPQVVSDLNNLVLKIIDQISRFQPRQILEYAWWKFVIASTESVDKKIDDSKQSMAAFILEYIQTIIISVKPINVGVDDISTESWSILESDITSLFTKLNMEYQICHSAYRESIQGEDFNEDLEVFRVKAEMHWVIMRGKRYHFHEKQALLDILSPHSDILVEFFDIDAVTLVEEIDKIFLNFLRVPELFIKASDLYNHAIDNISASEDNLEKAMIELLKNVSFKDDQYNVFSQLFALDLIDVEKVTKLPKNLVDELTWDPGEETKFFEPGEYCGWPLRILPTKQRPFIRLDDRVFCFNVYGYDNFYRILKRIIRLKQNCASKWEQKQKEISEELPCKYLSKLLPESKILRSVYYGDFKGKRCEIDRIIIYDNYLFVIEVKGGAFTYTSPATDINAHVKSLQNLVSDPSRQGNRFVNYLESKEEIVLFDEKGLEVEKIRQKNFKNIVICAITLDSFTELAARSQHLCKIGINTGNHPVWVLSIDDLRVYADLFDNPLIFLHFVVQRVRALSFKHSGLDDEIDHLGMYLEYSNYTQHIMNITNSGSNVDYFSALGYRKIEDMHFPVEIFKAAQ